MIRIYRQTIQKGLNDPDDHNGVVIHLEPDFLDCEVKWVQEALLQINLVEVMEFQLTYFKSEKMMLLNCSTQNVSKFGKLSSGHRTEKVNFHSNPKDGQCQIMFLLPYTCTHFTHQQGYAQNASSQASAVYELKTSRHISQILKEAEEPEIKLATFIGSWKKQGSSRKYLLH